jgi:hypothetical protein
MEGGVVDHPAEVLHVGLLVPDLVDQVVAAVLAQLLVRQLRELERVGLGHDVGVEGAGGHRHVDHAGAHCVADFEGRHRLRPADEVDLQRAFALGVELLGHRHQVLDIGRVLGERAHHAQRRFLGLGESRERRGQPEHDDFLHGLLR